MFRKFSSFITNKYILINLDVTVENIVQDNTVFKPVIKQTDPNPIIIPNDPSHDNHISVEPKKPDDQSNF
jgi:hypothetical protein